MDNRETLIEILSHIDIGEITQAMTEYTEEFGEPDFAYYCGNDAWRCTCGGNCGKDDDCFACGERDNLEVIEFRNGEY